jgi:hypothetical protein
LCKEECNQNVLVSLIRLAGGVEQEKKTATLEQDNVNFVFTKVFPGKYRIEVKQCVTLLQKKMFSSIFEVSTISDTLLPGEAFFIRGLG